MWSMRRSHTARANGSTAWPTLTGWGSFWATLNRAFHGVYHKMSRKYLQRYVNQFAQMHNVRDMDTLAQCSTWWPRWQGGPYVQRPDCEMRRVKDTKDELYAEFERIDNTPSPNPSYRGLTIQKAVRRLLKARPEPK